MKLKNQFLILSTLIISIPILSSVFILIHTYMHSPNRYLMKGSQMLSKTDLPSISEQDIYNIEISLKMLPQEVEAVLFRTSDRKIIYSTIPEIKIDDYMDRSEVLSFVSETSNNYYYQFSKMVYNQDILVLTRLPIANKNTEKNTKTYLKILLLIIAITISSLILILFISKAIFEGLNKIERSSFQLAEGKLDKPIASETANSHNNEFNNIMNSLEKMRQELIENQESKNRFIMGISHDLRTPVAVIKGYSEAIMDNVITDKDEMKDSMELIEQKTTQLEGMIDTLINFMKLNNVEIKEKLVPHSITKLITDFAKYAEVTGKVFKRNVRTNINIDEIKVPLNKQLIQRSFENLLSNAIRYTDENDLIEISAFNKQENNKKSIILKIQDSGYGIDKKDLDYIFDIFYRGTNSRQEEGMGIGLAVVKSIMDTHGWTISVESQKKKGSCFTITIPY